MLELLRQILDVVADIVLIYSGYVYIFKSGTNAIFKKTNQLASPSSGAKLANDDGAPCDRKAYLP